MGKKQNLSNDFSNGKQRLQPQLTTMKVDSKIKKQSRLPKHLSDKVKRQDQTGEGYTKLEQEKNKQQRNLKAQQGKNKQSMKVQETERDKLHTEDRKVASDHPQQQKKHKPMKHNRIIIRNLVVDINQKHLRKLLSPLGQVMEINIPMHPDKNISKGFAFVEFASKNQCHNAINKLNGTTYKGRTIILDLSLAKKVYLEQKLTKNHTPEPQKIQDNSQQKQQKEEQDIQDIQEQDKQENEDQSQIKQTKQQKHEEDHSSTIFIRNLPSSIDDKGLFQHFKKYGKIKYARVAMNPETHLSKGSGFIKFSESAPAKELVQESRSYQLYLSRKLHRFQPNPNINLQIEGKIIKIFDAMSRDNLENKVTERNKQDQKDSNKKAVPIKKIRSIQKLAQCDKLDKRNIKLALQGIWRAQETMRKTDYQKFKAHQREKLEKLKNPNHFVSKTRIILKHLNKAMTQEEIRGIAFQFLSQKKLKHKELKYCKLMLDQNMQKSAGFAFLQFANHQLSLGFVNWIKKHSQKVSKFPFICEFTVEDARKLLKKNKKIVKSPK